MRAPCLPITVKLRAEMQPHRHDAGAEVDETKHDPVVLVTEDNAVIGMMLADELQDAGYAVAGPFSHVATALAWLEGFSPDLAILDVLLKDGSCAPVARELRARGVPFLVFSGINEAPDMPELQGVPWIAKPSDFAEIAKALGTLRANSISSPEAGASPHDQQRRPTAADLSRTDPLRIGTPSKRSGVRPRVELGRWSPERTTRSTLYRVASALLRHLRVQSSATYGTR